MEWRGTPDCCAHPSVAWDDTFGTTLGDVCTRIVRCAACATLWLEEWPRKGSQRFQRTTSERARDLLGLIDHAALAQEKRLVRCPKCRSVNAGAVEHIFEITVMRCGSCGYESHEDHYSLKDTWDTDWAG